MNHSGTTGARRRIPRIVGRPKEAAQPRAQPSAGPAPACEGLACSLSNRSIFSSSSFRKVADEEEIARVPGRDVPMPAGFRA